MKLNLRSVAPSVFSSKVSLLFLILLFPIIGIAQQSVPADSCAQRDLPDLIRAARNKPPKVVDNSKGSLILVPIIGSNPATGFMIGAGGQYAFKMYGDETLYSMLSGSAQVTTKNQQLFLLKNNVYTKDNRIFFTGDWRYLIYSQPTYGLGTNSPEGGVLDHQYQLDGMETSSDSLAQPMKFNFLRFYQSASFNIRKGLYFGLGYNLDYYFKIQDEKLNLTPGAEVITSHYAYNQYYGYNQQKYYSSALNLNFIYDTRDNMINAYKGIYASISWRGALKLVGNKNNASFYNLEWRSFHPLSGGKNPRHVMAFWLLGNFSAQGKLPYLILPATAYDQRGRSARAYAQGRFRGNNLVYGEAEYRFPISSCGGIWGGVLFANATTANNPLQSLKLFESIKPGYGVGLRLMVDKQSRTNLAIDFAMGDKTTGFYLAASETF